jgi:hypothetical protein
VNVNVNDCKQQTGVSGQFGFGYSSHSLLFDHMEYAKNGWIPELALA